MTDRVVGVSVDAISAFPGYKATDKKFQVVHCGIDLAPFSDCNSDANKLRKDLDVPPDAKLLIFVGRMVPYKNPYLLFELLQKMIESGINVYAIFVGVGPLMQELAESAKDMNLFGKMKLLGKRNDIPLLMKASDLLVCPSVEDPKEGLGLVVVEAQAAGLPILMSKSIPDEAVVIPDLVTVLPLRAGSDVWAGAAIEILSSDFPGMRSQCTDKLATSSFSISNSYRNICDLYI